MFQPFMAPFPKIQVNSCHPFAKNSINFCGPKIKIKLSHESNSLKALHCSFYVHSNPYDTLENGS